MMDDNRIVAVGLLSARDMERLGAGFHRVYPVEGETAFHDLVCALDRIPWRDDREWSGKGAGQD